MSMGPTILMYGTSPRTRGKQLNVPNITPSRRNIPAHAGKTLQLRPRGERAAEHPRARGENVSIAEPFSRGNGTSPRTRGKPPACRGQESTRRNIPAHAGKTHDSLALPTPPEEHPRARGENPPPLGAIRHQPGTSPRTRGKQKSVIHSNADLRNIPAHAGKTPTFDYPHGRTSEHPRARGENIERPLQPLGSLGTSPRTRGKLDTSDKATSKARNIPAHAGKTTASP